MAKINIYGTLHNDTGEPIVDAEQVFDNREGVKRSITEILDGITSVTSDPPTGFSAEEMEELINEVKDSEA